MKKFLIEPIFLLISYYQDLFLYASSEVMFSEKYRPLNLHYL